MLISEDAKKQIDSWIVKYPAKRKRSALIAALKITQDENGGYLNEKIISAVADYLEIEKISAQEVATFYAMYEHKKIGKYKICVCHNISCMLNGADELISYLEKKLNIKVGETSADGLFTLKKVECLAACVGAPMMQIGDTYYENLTPGRIDEILDNLALF